MSEANFYPIYLRKTNGTGEKVNISPELTSDALHNLVNQTFNLTTQAFELFLKGQKISSNPSIPIKKLRIVSGSIVHIRQKIKPQQQSYQVRIFCQGSLYNYKTSKQSLISELKQQFATTLNCNLRNVTVSYLGKVLESNESFGFHDIVNNDLLSVTLIPFTFTQQNQMKLKPKFAQSVTFTPSEQDPTYQPFAKQLMRKSSMKSSQDSREALIGQSKKLLQIQRPKSQSQANTQQNLKKSQQNFNILKFPWLTNKKVIQTESINLDDPQLQSQNDQWTQCRIELINSEQTKFYIIECNETHTLQAVLKVLGRYERKQSSEFSVTFADENSQRMAEGGKAIIEIARINNTRIIHHVIFK